MRGWWRIISSKCRSANNTRIVNYPVQQLQILPIKIPLRRSPPHPVQGKNIGGYVSEKGNALTKSLQWTLQLTTTLTDSLVSLTIRLFWRMQARPQWIPDLHPPIRTHDHEDPDQFQKIQFRIECAPRFYDLYELYHLSRKRNKWLSGHTYHKHSMRYLHQGKGSESIAPTDRKSVV